MSPRVPIFLSAQGHRASEAYRVAVAELPLTVELAASPVGAVVVVDGRAPGGWSAEVDAALARGASGVVVDGVGVVDVPDVDDVLMRGAGGGVGAAGSVRASPRMPSPSAAPPGSLVCR
ncbi:hypothetical protein [Pseudoclavibacter helvolus]|uniref:hypothetical protein n=1 Tax=Pseudoclavibacter helvolus TaxID=255205 RepID=UPI003C73D46D